MMITQNRMKTVLTLAVVAMVFLALPAVADVVIPGPNDLPDPDGSTGSTDKPVKVFILAGQSNMVGFGRIAGTEPGTLQTLTGDGMFPHLVDGGGAWTVRNDVRYRGVITALGNGLLTPGFGANGSHFGPELGFGHIMGYCYDEPVIVLKSSQGNRSISWDYAPPSTKRFDYNGTTYGGYGDSPGTWPAGTEKPPAQPGAWYAGKQWDDCFMDEADWAPLGGNPVENVADVLDNFASQYPQYAAQGFEIAGYGWWQGHKDQGEPHASRYELNMTNFINDIRTYYEKRYPDNIIYNAPFVLATVAFDGGWGNTSAGYLAVANGQLAVSDPAKHPEFAGNVKTIEARGYWRDGSISPSTTGYHYNHNAETYMRVGDALGRAMAEIMPAYKVNAGGDMITWSGQQVELDATVQDGVSVTSYSWTAIPPDGVVFSNPTGQDTNVTITKTTDNPSTVRMRLDVNDGVNDPVSDVIAIDVYDDACKATRLGLGIEGKYDLNGNCITDMADLATAISTWLNDNSLTVPVIK